ncbi:MAG: GNAT family N-acetyltransferase [Oscillospiraceae bacterium]|nr:GNAT family N-acetyltransferase [Oscillospiraceae bacterium]
MTIRPMTLADYPALLALWNACLSSPRDLDDTPEAVAGFLRRNPGLSVVAVEDKRGAAAPPQVVGSILCGHDGRRGYLYHVAVDAAHRRGGVARAMVQACLAALRAAGIRKCALIAFTKNEGGNAFWHAMGFAQREDMYYREIAL